jgi:hypothetical protein
MITVACVLKLGGVYTREWVYALKRGLSRHLSDFEFVCLTDDVGLNPPSWRVPLDHNLRGWWSKLEAFRPDVFPEGGRVLFMDLDTLPVGDMSAIAGYAGEFAMISDFFQPKLAQSGVMAWTVGPVSHGVWQRFMADPAGAMRRYRGDGEFIRSVVPKADRLQALYPGQIVSLKVHAPARGSGPPKGARLVAGHGNPRFNTPAAGWAYREWMSLATVPQSEAA